MVPRILNSHTESYVYKAIKVEVEMSRKTKGLRGGGTQKERVGGSDKLNARKYLQEKFKMPIKYLTL